MLISLEICTVERPRNRSSSGAMHAFKSQMIVEESDKGPRNSNTMQKANPIHLLVPQYGGNCISNEAPGDWQLNQPGISLPTKHMDMWEIGLKSPYIKNSIYHVIVYFPTQKRKSFCGGCLWGKTTGKLKTNT